jgi:hypothetical protein
MKLRIKGNSIRLRLLKSEVEKFAEQGYISDEVRFGDGTLKYSVRMSDSADVIKGIFAENEIVVVIPEKAARDWAGTESVGFEAEQPIAANESLTIVIEKDFVCMDRLDDPDRADAYPNPNIEC